MARTYNRDSRGRFAGGGGGSSSGSGRKTTTTKPSGGNGRRGPRGGKVGTKAEQARAKKAQAARTHQFHSKVAVSAAKEAWKKAQGESRKDATRSARATVASIGGGRRANPAAQRAKEMANRTGTASGRFYSDGRARTTMSLAQLRSAVRAYARSKGALNRSDFVDVIALAGGITQKGRGGLEVGRMPRTRGDWEQLYKSSVRLPEYNRGQRPRRGMVNGIDIHRDFRPWAVFNLNPKTATAADVNQAFRRLASKVHPDAGGRARDFARLQQMRNSLIALMPAPKAAQGGSRRAASKAASPTTPAAGPRLLPPASSPKSRRRRR